MFIIDSVAFEEDKMAASFDAYKDTSGYTFKPFIHPKDCERCEGAIVTDKKEMHFFHDYSHTPTTRKRLEEIQYQSELHYEQTFVQQTHEVMSDPEDDIIIVKELEKLPEKDKSDGPMEAVKRMFGGEKPKKSPKKRMSFAISTTNSCNVSFKCDTKISDLKIRSGEKRYSVTQQGVFHYLDDEGTYHYEIKFNN